MPSAIGNGETNANALNREDVDHVDDGVGSDDDDDDDDDSKDSEVEASAARIIAWLRMTGITLFTMAGAFYLSRKMTASMGGEVDWADRLAGESGRQMSGVESQLISAKYSPGCVDCGVKSFKTVTRDNDQKHASKNAVVGSRELHAAYAKADDFAPPRVYHNYWAAGDFPSQYYSKSDTIKNYRFRRIFGWENE